MLAMWKPAYAQFGGSDCLPNGRVEGIGGGGVYIPNAPGVTNSCPATGTSSSMATTAAANANTSQQSPTSIPNTSSQITSSPSSTFSFSSSTSLSTTVLSNITIPTNLTSYNITANSSIPNAFNDDCLNTASFAACIANGSIADVEDFDDDFSPPPPLPSFDAPVCTNKDPEEEDDEEPADEPAADTVEAAAAAAEVGGEGLTAAAAAAVAAGVAAGIAEVAGSEQPVTNASISNSSVILTNGTIISGAVNGTNGTMDTGGANPVSLHGTVALPSKTFFPLHPTRGFNTNAVTNGTTQHPASFGGGTATGLSGFRSWRDPRFGTGTGSAVAIATPWKIPGDR